MGLIQWGNGPKDGSGSEAPQLNVGDSIRSVYAHRILCIAHSRDDTLDSLQPPAVQASAKAVVQEDDDEVRKDLAP